MRLKRRWRLERALVIEPCKTYVLQFDELLTEDDANMIRARLRRQAPGSRFIFIGPGVRFVRESVAVTE